MSEIWKRIPGFENKYAVSNHGLVKSFINNPNGEIVTFVIGTHGYYLRSMRDTKGKVTCVKLHRVVAKMFIPNPNNLLTVNHIDGNKLNNHVDNLEWVTLQDNIQHAIDTNLRKRSYVQKLNENYVREIRSKYETTNITIKELATEYKVAWNAINKILRYNTWFNIDPDLKYTYRVNRITKKEHREWKYSKNTKPPKKIIPKTPWGKLGISEDELKTLVIEFVNGLETIYEFCEVKSLNVYQFKKYISGMVELPIILNEGEIKFKYRAYILTTHGRVWSLLGKHRVNTHIVHNQRVGSIIGAKFLDKPEDGKYIGFKNGNITNTNINNLFWIRKKKRIKIKIDTVIIPEDTIENIKRDYIYGGFRYLDITEKYGYTIHYINKTLKGVERIVKPKTNTKKTKHPNRFKLTQDICEKIRHQFIYDNLNVNNMSHKYSLTKTTIYEILNNKLLPSQNQKSAILIKRDIRHYKK